MKTLSLIVPTYNVDKYLGNCLDSLPLERNELEVLIIIDGSKDNSSQIASNYQQKYPATVKVIEKENGHYGSCVNVGLSIAQGKYVKILDADDTFDKNILEYLFFLNEVDSDVIITNAVFEDEEKKILRQISFPLEPYILFDIDVLNNNEIVIIHHYEITYRRELLLRMDYKQTQGISYTDLEWSSLPFSLAKTGCYYPKIIYRYLKGREGQTVGAEYRKTNMWMENKVVLGLVSQYERRKIEIPLANKALLRKFVSTMVAQVYSHYLVNFSGILNESELLKFDKELNQISEEMYQAQDDLKDVRKFGTYYYVRDFREKGTRKQLKYIVYDILRNISLTINKLLQN